jgi:hypothetical protein
MKWSMFGFHSRKAAWCCVGGRLLVLWLLLCSFDKHFSASKSKALSNVKSDVADARRHGPNLNMPSGMGYSDIFWDPDLDYNPQRVKAKALSVQLTEYIFYGLHLQLVEGLLPQFERGTSFGIEPPELLVEMLLGSKILNYCTELLRKDSLEATMKRKNLYQTLFNLLHTLDAQYLAADSTVYND